MPRSSIDAAEVKRFAAMADDWWDPRGPMAALHKLNPLRLGYIRDKAAERFGRDTRKLDCLKGLRILDIGCGGGILSEPLARLGAEMVGADPSEENIAAASAHARESGVAVDYRATTAEDLAAAAERFDVALAMEVVEHVADADDFVATCASMVKPGGLMVAATLNRTLKSFALAIVRRHGRQLHAGGGKAGKIIAHGRVAATGLARAGHLFTNRRQGKNTGRRAGAFKG